MVKKSELKNLKNRKDNINKKRCPTPCIAHCNEFLTGIHCNSLHLSYAEKSTQIFPQRAIHKTVAHNFEKTIPHIDNYDSPNFL